MSTTCAGVEPGDDLDPAPDERQSPPDRGEGDEVVGPAGPVGLRRLLTLSVVLVLLGVTVGYLGTGLAPEKFAARAELVYRLTDSEPNELLREDRRLTSQLVLLRSRVVLAPVAAAHGMTPELLAERVDAEVIDSSEIIEVQVWSSTPQDAHRILTEIVDGYLALANSEWKDPVRSHLDEQRTRVREDRRKTPLSAEAAADLARRENFLTELIDALPVEPKEYGPPARRLVDPYVPLEPVSPKPLLGAAAGGVSAFLVAALIVLLAVRRGSRR